MQKEQLSKNNQPKASRAEGETLHSAKSKPSYGGESIKGATICNAKELV